MVHVPGLGTAPTLKDRNADAARERPLTLHSIQIRYSLAVVWRHPRVP